ncbi:hypothetical protein FOXG_21483 [Fusarium oxysporum f. sp. lycopersici 4287]|uniref:Uncharacterized protein n=1 Tax=Fusarium oxysporum f. sp. lycopersici (strain 4287 / CBS 123668 / FGSC 9935 / NRRL 34936) TaxID=426428 RepID=A0A0J9WTC4_FUSO4|nr:hypothetical protein FOXG_21483 [Fusarium oxysporum f. sp. lycopersici 4287]KNB15787.1 hypothetical protein FOXG_21483 [Fusarium oxysporum f. sp. lycopersici 4287]
MVSSNLFDLNAFSSHMADLGEKSCERFESYPYPSMKDKNESTLSVFAAESVPHGCDQDNVREGIISNNLSEKMELTLRSVGHFVVCDFV